MKILLVTFSDNADHQDSLFGMYEALIKDKEFDTYLLAINTPKVSLKRSDHTWLVDCPPRPGICKKTFNILLLLKIIHKIKQEHFDVIYFESLHIWNLPIMMAIKGETHIFHAIHDVIPHQGDQQARQVDLFNKALSRISDTIVLRSKKFIPLFIQQYRVAPDKVKYFPLWRRFPEYTSPCHSHRALFFGRMNPYKGVDNLQEIVRLCPAIQFDVVGKVDPQIANIVENLSNAPNVHLQTGYVSDAEMKHYFIQDDWIIVPYNSATQSGIIIDAYKYSRPVIAFDVGAIASQIVQNKTGYLIHANDVAAFAQKLQSAAVMNNDEYDCLSQQAYAFGRGKYAAMGKVQEFKKFIMENM